ncbi:MAG: hypothetical protein AB7T38_09230 [Nitrospirales bacterium]
MTPFPQPWFRIVVGVCLIFMAHACVPSLRWVQDPLDQPSCRPDRLLQWSDFTPRQGKDARAAETAIRFTLDQKTHTLQVVFDSEHSWVKPELADPQNPIHSKMSEQLLAHEQIHYLISCLVVRQANQTLSQKDNLAEILPLAQSVAQRINLQYDADTQHGTRLSHQDSWQKEIMRQFEELGSTSEKSNPFQFSLPPKL